MTSIPAANPLVRTADNDRFPELRCGACGYGRRPIAADRCPVCGGTVWDFQDWRPFSAFFDDVDRPLTRGAH